MKIQNHIRRKLALKRVRLLYQAVVKEELDVVNDRAYYQNPKTGIYSFICYMLLSLTRQLIRLQ